MDFMRAAEILYRRKWLIVLSVVLTLALTWGSTRLSGSRWMATVKFVSPEVPAIVGQAGDGTNGEAQSASSESKDKDQVAIYTGVLKSRDVIMRMLQKLQMQTISPDFLDNVDFSSSGPRMYQLTVTDSTKDGAVKTANALADSFVEVYHHLYTQQAAKAVQLLQEQLRSADAKLAKTRDRYDLYCRDHHIAGDMKDQLEPAFFRLEAEKQRREYLQEQSAEIEARIQRAESELARSPQPAAVEETAPPNAAVKQLEEEVNAAEQQVATLRQRYTDDYPIVVRAIAHWKDLSDQLKQAREQHPVKVKQPDGYASLLQKDIARMEQEQSACRAQIDQIDRAIAGANSDVNKLQVLSGPLAFYTGELSQQTDIRTGIAARLNSAQRAVDVAERQIPISVMDRPNEFNPPVNTKQGKSTKLMLLAAMGSLICTCAVVIAQGSIDRRVKTVQEAEVGLPAPVIAAIPQPIGETTYSELARVTELNPQSLASEAYRFLAMHLLSERGMGIRSIMALSAKPEQGSTTTLANLGITLAQSGKRVIIVDANSRSAEMHHVFNLPNDFGFTDLIDNLDGGALERAMHATSISNLHVITGGTMPQNTWRLFRSKNLSEVAQRLRDRADYVLYDTPSALIFTDALNLAPIMDGAFLCVRALQPLTGGEQRLIESVQQANVPVLGCVLSDVPTAFIGMYDNYQHYYKSAAQAAQPLIEVGDRSEG